MMIPHSRTLVHLLQPRCVFELESGILPSWNEMQWCLIKKKQCVLLKPVNACADHYRGRRSYDQP